MLIVTPSSSSTLWSRGAMYRNKARIPPKRNLESWLTYMPWWSWVRQRYGKWYSQDMEIHDNWKKLLGVRGCWPQRRSWTPNLRRLESKATESYRNWPTTDQQAPNMTTKCLKALANAECSPAKLPLFLPTPTPTRHINSEWPKATGPTMAKMLRMRQGFQVA